MMPEVLLNELPCSIQSFPFVSEPEFYVAAHPKTPLEKERSSEFHFKKDVHWQE